MLSLRHLLAVSFGLVIAAVSTVAAGAESGSRKDPWAGQTFLSDYSKLRPVEDSPGHDYVYVVPRAAPGTSRYRSVMFDQPEVFISPDSPYKGAKPADVEAIAELIRSTTIAALKQRGYEIVDRPGPQTVYVRMAVTDLQISKKSRRLLAYTPVGFAVDVAVKALQSFMDKFDILDVALQVEIHDSQSGNVLAQAVLRRGKSADSKRPIPFDDMVVAADELGQRFACRLDNGRVAAAERIDCRDPVARDKRPLLVE
jgi:hypothetical protein